MAEAEEKKHFYWSMNDLFASDWSIVYKSIQAFYTKHLYFLGFEKIWKKFVCKICGADNHLERARLQASQWQGAYKSFLFSIFLVKIQIY